MVQVVALSGGVDSSVAAGLLRETCVSASSYREKNVLVGAMHLIWPGSRCCDSRSVEIAREICRRLGIPFYPVELYEEFNEIVVRDFVDTYLEGKTPNPCVICNQRIRFDLFIKELRVRLTQEAVMSKDDPLQLATGHYARIERAGGEWVLKKGKDPLKDQSYMLYRIPRKVLPHLSFPLGHLRKSEVVKMASEWDLPAVRSRESQDACFIRDSYADFVMSRTGRPECGEPGEIVDCQGRVVGRHRGYVRYTVGQRRGLGLPGGPWYVARVDSKTNRIVVGRRSQVHVRSFFIQGTNWLFDSPFDQLECEVKVRYQDSQAPCVIEPVGGDCCHVELRLPDVVAPGQSAVFYRDDLVMGGGIISETGR